MNRLAKCVMLAVVASAISWAALGCDDDKSENKEETKQKVTYDTPDRSTIPAFPGADGAGKYTTGGAGGEVYHVTTLSNSGTGSLRSVLSTSSTKPTIVVFDVSGIIELASSLEIAHSNITIAGQTAPGDGICIKNYPVVVKANNVIIRYMRFRMGDEKKTEDDAIWGRGNKNIIIDHCSMSWSTDECSSFYGNNNFTMQWCILSESLTKSIHDKGAHGYGGIWGGEPASFHHNLIADHSSRTPRLNGSRWTYGGSNKDTEKVDLRNNVFYNWGPVNGGYAGEGGSYNFVNNYYKPGPSTATKSVLVAQIFMADCDNGENNGTNSVGDYGYFWMDGNVFDGTCPEVKANSNNAKSINDVNNDNFKGLKLGSSFSKYSPSTTVAQLQAKGEFDIAEYSFTESAEEAFASVTEYAGASYKRDVVDERIVKNVRNGDYNYEGSNGSSNGLIDTQNDVGGYPTYNQEEKPTDSDRDGMPDAWEGEMGLDASTNDASDYNLSPSYTNIEVYINGLVEKTFPQKAL